MSRSFSNSRHAPGVRPTAHDNLPFIVSGIGIGMGLYNAPTHDFIPGSERFGLSFLPEAAISRQGMFNLRLETCRVQS
jgi:hypothetical protein